MAMIRPLLAGLAAVSLVSCATSGDRLPVSAARATNNIRTYLNSPAAPPHFGTRFAGSGPDGSMGSFLVGNPTKVNHAAAPVAVYHIIPQGQQASKLELYVRPQGYKGLTPPQTDEHRRLEYEWRRLLRGAAVQW